MSRFLTQLDVTLVQPAGWVSRAKWRLRSALVYESERIGRVSVPAGTVTDFASVPRLPLAMWLAGESVYRPAVVHDWLYRSSDWPRRVCDDVFLEAMQAVDVPGWRRQSMYSAVRLFGGRSYRRHRDAHTTA